MPYSSDKEPHTGRGWMMMVFIPTPALWLRTRRLYNVITNAYDKDFTKKEFMKGAKQAVCHVSRLLSQCQFQALDGLVATDLRQKLEKKCKELPLNYRKALSVAPAEIVFYTTKHVGFHSGGKGRRFVTVLMCFWYWTPAKLPDDAFKGVPYLHLPNGDDPRRLLTATYEFQREFAKGVEPAWIITRIEHLKLLE